MSKIRVHCSSCKERADLPPRDISLHIHRLRSETRERLMSSYAFVCPSCDSIVTKTADESVISVLLSGGVDPCATHVAGAVGAHNHPEDPPAGPAFTSDDLLDFHQLLERDDWYQSVPTWSESDHRRE